MWRRQYPVPFRVLTDDKQYRRWDWIEYDFKPPSNDRRSESQWVVRETLSVPGKLAERERASFLSPLVRSALAESNELGESLSLVRPLTFDLSYHSKGEAELRDEERKHKALADQLSLLDAEAKPLKVCPVQFTLRWKDQDGHSHRHECDDWETAAAYNKFNAAYGHKQAVDRLIDNYNKYFERGLVLGLSTHKRRNVTTGTDNQWLLVGMIRLDESTQRGLDL